MHLSTSRFFCFYWFVSSQTSHLSEQNIVREGGGEGGAGGSEPHACRNFYSHFPSSFRSRFRLCSISIVKCEILCNAAKFFSKFSRFPLGWESRFPPSLLRDSLPRPLFSRAPLCPPSQYRNIFYTFCPFCLHIILQARIRDSETYFIILLLQDEA